MTTTSQQIRDLVDAGALFVANDSGGKDSQAMLIRLLEIVPRAQLLVVHADLGVVEWAGTLEHARDRAAAAGVPFLVAKALDRAGAEKSFVDMVERRFATRPDVPSFPSAKYRQCTSDLKRGPIEREVKAYAKARGLKLIVNCEGIRAAESAKRAKAQAFKVNAENSKAGRTWYDWLPIFDLSTDQVFATIAAAGQSPHWAYAAGNERLSCVFCIMGSPRDIANGARHNPDLLARFVELEQRTGYTMHESRKPLLQLVAEGQAILDQLELKAAA
jgi:3'-phosphoadenosine 5'-phosphosulfate sulfotransferase (PAPS reductase)/FAD synthetase